jgi:hypothetical protein
MSESRATHDALGAGQAAQTPPSVNGVLDIDSLAIENGRNMDATVQFGFHVFRGQRVLNDFGCRTESEPPGSGTRGQ